MDLRKESNTYDKVLGNLEATVASFLETGFVEFIMPEQQANAGWRPYWNKIHRDWPIGMTFYRKVIKHIAREVKRPVVVVELKPWTQGFYITIKKRKFTAPLIAPFLLLDESIEGSRGWRKMKGVNFRQDTANYYLKFEREKDYREWRKHCLTHPDCRKALKLPPSDGRVINMPHPNQLIDNEINKQLAA